MWNNTTALVEFHKSRGSNNKMTLHGNTIQHISPTITHWHYTLCHVYSDKAQSGPQKLCIRAWINFNQWERTKCCSWPITDLENGFNFIPNLHVITLTTEAGEAGRVPIVRDWRGDNFRASDWLEQNHSWLSLVQTVSKGSGQKKKTGYFMTSSQIHLPPTHPT